MKTEHSIKLEAKNAVDLDRLSYSSGMIVYDVDLGSLRIMDGVNQGGSTLATRTWTLGTISSLGIGNGTQTVTAGSYLTGGGSFTANQTNNSSITLAVDATDANTASKIVARDASGNFSAGTITAALTGNVTGNLTGAVTGNASTATTLQTARTINGVSFNGSANITVSASATTLTGTALNSIVVGSNLTSVGTLTSLNVSGDIQADSNIVLNTTPTVNNHTTNKKYVDARSVAMSIALS
jgi:hypothetical protein